MATSRRPKRYLTAEQKYATSTNAHPLRATGSVGCATITSCGPLPDHRE